MPEDDELTSAEPEGPRGPIGATTSLVGGWGGDIQPESAEFQAAQPIAPSEFGISGQSIEAPESYTGGNPVGGPSSIFNIGGAPITVLGGVFSEGMPIGGPVTQIFRSGAPVPNTQFIATLAPSGPIGNFLVGSGGGAIGDVGEIGVPIGGTREGGSPIGGDSDQTEGR